MYSLKMKDIIADRCLPKSRVYINRFIVWVCFIVNIICFIGLWGFMLFGKGMDETLGGVLLSGILFFVSFCIMIFRLDDEYYYIYREEK